jgi:surface-anchored protein
MGSANRLSARPLLVALLLACGSLTLGAPAKSLAGRTVVDMTRINIDIDYSEKEGWNLAAHDEFHDIAYDADAVLFYANKGDRRTVPNDPDFAFLGADPGETYWGLPMVFDPGRLSVGVSVESIAANTFASYFETDSRVQATGPWVKVTFTAVRGPGNVSVWQNDYWGRPIVWMATVGGFTEDNAVFVLASRDSDYNWAFTAPGIYEIDVVASAYLPEEDPVCSDVVTYTFGIEATNLELVSD